MVRPSFEDIYMDLAFSLARRSTCKRLHVGTVCWLTLPGLESLQAEVVWWEGALCGCAFTQLMSPIVHDNLLARFRGDGVYRAC